MIVLGFGLAIAAGCLLWSAMVRRTLFVEARPDEIYRVETEDGWNLALLRYHPDKKAARKKHPVVLCPGLASNGAIYDSPGVSLARYLAALGYEVFVPELRGNGRSERAKLFSRAVNKREFSLDDCLDKDLPAVIGKVLELTRAPSVHWCGHSMGAILMYAFLESRRSHLIKSGVAMAAALDYSTVPNNFKSAAVFRPILQLAPFLPVAKFYHTLAPFAGWLPKSIEYFVFYSPNLSHAFRRRVFASYFEDVPMRLMLQLESAVKPGGVRSLEGLSYMDKRSTIKTPIFAISGCHDMQCPPAAVKETLDGLGSDEKEYVSLPFGHVDLLCSEKAMNDVFPRIADWLDRHDG
jgi:alpha-beta hydrolase superfamily lysophospholipase